MKRYEQHCPLASALDLIGDRWTLLIVRELLFLGPRRFTDLGRGLPGLAPNLLTSRLRTLEEAGIVQRAEGHPPATASVYLLTAEGARLREPVVALMRWGISHMVPLDENDPVRPEMVSIALQAAFVPEFAGGVDASYEIVLDELTLSARVRAGVLELSEGPSPDPALRIQIPLRLLVELVNAEVEAMEAVASGRIQIEGDPIEVDRFLQLFGGLVPLVV